MISLVVILFIYMCCVMLVSFAQLHNTATQIVLSLISYSDSTKSNVTFLCEDIFLQYPSFIIGSVLETIYFHLKL